MTIRVIRIRRRAIAGVAGLILLAAAVPIGIGNTPYADGHAVVLTRGRLEMVQSVRALATWVVEVRKELDVLETILGESAASPDSGRLLAEGERGAEALRRLGAVAREVEGARVPEAMSELQRQAREALGSAIAAGQAVVECVGAPRAEAVAEAWTRLREARGALEELDGRVWVQRGMLWR